MSGETIHERYMRLALEEAKEANRLGEIPVGAVAWSGAVTYWVVGTICAKPDTVLWPMRKCWRWKKPAVLSVIGGWMDAIYM